MVPCLEVHSLTHSPPTNSSPFLWGPGVARHLTCVRECGSHVGWLSPARLRLWCRREAQGTGGSQHLPRLTLTRHSLSTWVMFYLEVELLVSSVFYKPPEGVLSCPFCSADPLHKNQCVWLAGRAVWVAHIICIQSILLLGKHLIVLRLNLFSLVAD